MNFVFFHVGSNITLPHIMVDSILEHNPFAEIIQVTDDKTPTVPGITYRFITEVNYNYLMLSRVLAWANLNLNKPAIYMDTDMVVNAQIDIITALNNSSVAMCRRSYNRNTIFNTQQRGLEFPEYSGMKIDDLYPWLGCCTITQNGKLWAQLAEMYLSLPEKFWRWYGDQEVLRDYAKINNVVELPEKVWAGLPEYKLNPLITHYKGNRKNIILKSVHLGD